jgi:hypothetical protein
MYMLSKFISLILMVFFICSISGAQAEIVSAAQKTNTAAPSNMNDAALASYISGKLEPLLKDTGYSVSENCDSSGCSVVVQ